MRQWIGRMMLRWGRRLSGDGIPPYPDRHEYNIVEMRRTTDEVRGVVRRKKARPSGNPIGDSIAGRRRHQPEVRRHG